MFQVGDGVQVGKGLGVTDGVLDVGDGVNVSVGTSELVIDGVIGVLVFDGV